VAQNFQVVEPLNFLAALTPHIRHAGAHVIRYYGRYATARFVLEMFP